jgi:hypothetical protein
MPTLPSNGATLSAGWRILFWSQCVEGLGHGACRCLPPRRQLHCGFRATNSKVAWDRLKHHAAIIPIPVCSHETLHISAVSAWTLTTQVWPLDKPTRHPTLVCCDWNREQTSLTPWSLLHRLRPAQIDLEQACDSIMNLVDGSYQRSILETE